MTIETFDAQAHHGWLSGHMVDLHRYILREVERFLDDNKLCAARYETAGRAEVFYFSSSREVERFARRFPVDGDPLEEAIKYELERSPLRDAKPCFQSTPTFDFDIPAASSWCCRAVTDNWTYGKAQ